MSTLKQEQISWIMRTWGIKKPPMQMIHDFQFFWSMVSCSSLNAVTLFNKSSFIRPKNQDLWITVGAAAPSHLMNGWVERKDDHGTECSVKTAEDGEETEWSMEWVNNSCTVGAERKRGTEDRTSIYAVRSRVSACLCEVLCRTTI